MNNNCPSADSSASNNSKWWNNTRVFHITNNLADWLNKSNLCEKDKEFCAFVQNKIICLTEDNEESLFVNIHSKYIRSKMNRHTVRIINILKDNGFIEVNPKYSNRKGREFPRSYRLPLSCWESKIRRISFSEPTAPPKDKSKIDTPLIRFILNCLNELTLSTCPLPYTGDALKDAHITYYAQQIGLGIWNLHFTDKGKRCFHPIICANRELRPLLIFKNNPAQWIFESDVQTCHPVLLLSLAEDVTEREEYKRLLLNDIYQSIAYATGCVRDDIKELTLIFVNGKVTSNPVSRYFQEHFPILTQAILKLSNPAIYLQNMESDIICRKVGSAAMEKNIWFIPMHDGFLTKSQEDTRIIGEMVQNEIENVSGYRPTIKTHLLNNCK